MQTEGTLDCRCTGPLKLLVHTHACLPTLHVHKYGLTFTRSPSLPAADEQAFGSREDKFEGCVLQRRAWDANAELLTAVFTAVREPLPKERRSRGELGDIYEKQQAATIRKRDQMGTVSEEMDARRAIEEAASGPVGEASRKVLQG